MLLLERFKVDGRFRAAAILALLPIAAFYLILFREMRNVPIIDDYPSILTFVVAFRLAPTWGQKLLLLITTQFHEYKLIFMNAVVALQVICLGHVNFSFFIVCGNLLVLGVLWLLWKHSFTAETDLARRVMLFVPVCFLLFQLNWTENLDWAICDLQTVPVLFFTLASLHLLLKPERRSFQWACLCALLGCFSSANAFLFAPIGFFLLLEKRRWKEIAAWITTFCVALALYLYKYTLIVRSDHGTNVSLLDKFLFYLSFLGGAVENMHRFPIKGGAIGIGLILLTAFCYSWRSGFRKANPFFFYMALWCLISGAMVAQERSGIGIILSLLSRYKVYCDFMLIYCYIYAVHRFDIVSLSPRRKRTFYYSALAAVIILAIVSDAAGYKFLANRQQRVELGLNEYTADPLKNVPMISENDQPIPQQEPEDDRILLNQAIALGVYKLPAPNER
jgi:hypothetical protein